MPAPWHDVGFLGRSRVRSGDSGRTRSRLHLSTVVLVHGGVGGGGVGGADPRSAFLRTVPAIRSLFGYPAALEQRFTALRRCIAPMAFVPGVLCCSSKPTVQPRLLRPRPSVQKRTSVRLD